MNRLISQALAIRSTKTPRRVTQARPRRPARACTGARALGRSRPRPPARAARDFLEQPAEVLDRLIVVGEDPDGVLDGHGADALQPAPHLHPEVVGLRRDVVKQQQPKSTRGIAHRGATRLSITSVSSNIRSVEWEG